MPDTVAGLTQAVWTQLFTIAAVVIIGGAIPTILTSIYYLVREAID